MALAIWAFVLGDDQDTVWTLPLPLTLKLPPPPRTVSCWISCFPLPPCCVVVTDASEAPSCVVVRVACGPLVTDAGAICSTDVAFRLTPKIA